MEMKMMSHQDTLPTTGTLPSPPIIVPVLSPPPLQTAPVELAIASETLYYDPLQSTTDSSIYR
jgi:hypothetical protein